MVSHPAPTERTYWIRSIAFSIIVPILLFSAFLIVSRVAIRSLYGPGDFPAILVCTVAGAIPIFRLRYPLPAKIGLSFVYILVFAMLLVLHGYAIDCSLFHDCD
jgi:hypothetical protein